MYKLIATILLVASVHAFTTPTQSALIHAPRTATFSTDSIIGTSTTALSLKVKVDPDAKGNDNAAGNAKMAAYGGSVLVALALPFLFLIWSAVGK